MSALGQAEIGACLHGLLPPKADTAAKTLRWKCCFSASFAENLVRGVECFHCPTIVVALHREAGMDRYNRRRPGSPHYRYMRSLSRYGETSAR